MKKIKFTGKGLLVVLGLFLVSLLYSQSNQEEDEVIYRFNRVVFSELKPAFPLPEEVDETSGLIFYRDLLWTHNDSGGEPEIYAVDTADGTIVQTIKINGATNKDWEDIAMDEQYIYIGDFGNNLGDRKDLRIYRISKTEIPENGNAAVASEVIDFSFFDQVDFSSRNLAHDYDCESMIISGENIFLFSKNWLDGNTRIYKLPAIPGTYSAEFLYSLDVNGLITGADIYDKSNRVVLIGYRNFFPFMVLINDLGTSNASPDYIKVDFPHITGIQSEGITFIDSLNVFVSCENYNTEQQVYTFNLKDWERMNEYDIDQAVLSNWEYSLLSKKKKNEKFVAIDLSALRFGVFFVELEKYYGGRVTFPDYSIDRHMGKSYLKLDVHPLKVDKYKIIVGTGNRRSEKEIFLDD